MLTGMPIVTSLCSQCDMTAPIAALYQNINVNQMTTNTSSVFQKKTRCSTFGQNYAQVIHDNSVISTAPKQLVAICLLF